MDNRLPPPDATRIDVPRITDGAAVHRLAASTTLDRNSPYAYLMVCRDFARTSAVARASGSVVGFVAAYRRPEAPDTLFVWQVAVADDWRGHGLARRMIDDVLGRDLAFRYLEATVTPTNAASLRLFRSFARADGARCEEVELFGVGDFPPDSDHEAEVLLRVGPLR